MINDITNNAKKYFLSRINDTQPDTYKLIDHITELEKWVEIITKRYPQTNKEILLLSVYLHDTGHYPINREVDHAITSEKLTKIFLENEKYDSDKTLNVLHCVRAHRCKDVMPNTLEAKAMAFIDSASHMTDKMYIDMIKNGDGEKASSKLERDYRDLAIFPEIQSEMTDIYSAWKILIENLIKLQK
jgi:hypothetical protein